MMISSLNFTIVTTDLDNLIPFYRDILKIPMKNYIKNKVAIFRLNGMQFQIYEQKSPYSHHKKDDDNKGTVVIGFSVSGPLESIREELKSKDVKIRSEIIKDQNSPIDMLFIEDFDGNEICLSEWIRMHLVSQ
jgi:hypothetical protein